MYRVALISEAVPSGIVLVVTLIGKDAKSGDKLYFNMPMKLDDTNANILHFSSIYGIQRFEEGFVTYARSEGLPTVFDKTKLSILM